MAAVEELAVDRGRGGDAKGVALAASYGHALVERDALGGLQLGGSEEVGDFARHVEDDRQFRDQSARVDGRVLGQEVCDGGADGAVADVVFAGEGSDGPAFQVRGAYVADLRGRDGGAAPALVALRLGGPQPVVCDIP
ncbi:hypothetical protein [Streptomyces sp. NPDC050392]|uniref:hypothetical protein n=1 Tax=Streptomyces sp. NPDC050392 TaxID=3155782 RepID=UPI003431F633